MASILPDYEYDIFISYRQKDNKYDGWVTEFVENLRKELEATFKEDISVYFDENPHDGLLETHIVDKSLTNKLNCLIFIPIISRTYCDPNCFAWQHEFLVFNNLSKNDPFGRDIKLQNGNVARRILPVKIHNIDAEDKSLLENELGGDMRAIEFIYREAGINRPLKPADNKLDNQNRTDYRNQVNKTANAIKDIFVSLTRPSATNNLKPEEDQELKRIRPNKRLTTSKWYYILAALVIVMFLGIAVFIIGKQSSGMKISTSQFKNEITKNPFAYEWYKKTELGLSPENPNDVDSCIYFLKKAIEADPSFALAYVKLSQMYGAKNTFIDPNAGYDKEATLAAEKSIFLNPNLAEGYYVRAVSFWTFKNKFPHEMAIREYKKAIALKPEMADAWHSLGNVYWHVGLMKEAEDAFKRSLKIKPEDFNIKLDLINCYFFSGKKQDLEQAIRLYKQIPDHLILSAFRIVIYTNALITLDRSDEAENIIYSSIKKDSLRISSIKKDSLRASSIKKDSLDLLLYNSSLAILLARKGDTAAALKRIEFCEKGNLNSASSHHVVYNLAIASTFLGNYQKAVDELKWAAEYGFPNYLCFRDDELLSPLHNFAPYNDLLKELKIQWEKFRKIAKE